MKPLDHTILNYVGNAMTPNGKPCVSWHEHQKAILAQAGFADALRQMLLGWEAYAEAHYNRYSEQDSQLFIGNDGYAARYWEMIAEGLRGLLSCETGGWDCGSIDANILRIAKEHQAEIDT